MKRRILITAAAALLASVIAAVAANNTFVTAIGDLVFPFSPPPKNGGPGTIDNMTIGGSTPAAGSFSSVATPVLTSPTNTITATGQTITAAKINAALGAYVNNPASTSYYPQYTFANGVTQITFNVGSTTSYAYVTLDANPYDGKQACIFTTVTITTLYVYANVGQTIDNAITTLAANGHVCYQYSLANTTWFRTQ